MIWGMELKDPEFLVVIILADSASSALSIALSDKQVLSARTLVCAISTAQISMLGAIVWAVCNRSGSTDRQWRYQIFWWGGITSSVFDPDTLFWMLYVVKALSILRGVLRSMALTSAFNIAEREAAHERRTGTAPSTQAIQQGGNNHSAPVLKSKILLGIPIPRLFTASTPLRISYSDSTATTSFAAAEYMPQTINSIVAVERLMNQIRPESGYWMEWGQMAQVGITVFGLLRLLYSIFYRLIWKRPESFRGWRRLDEPMRAYLKLLNDA